MQQMIFIADLIACSTCSRHHYANHQELESVAACGIWCFGVSRLRAATRKPDTFLFIFSLQSSADTTV
jgi:hypothetical protein